MHIHTGKKRAKLKEDAHRRMTGMDPRKKDQRKVSRHRKKQKGSRQTSRESRQLALS